ncbi:carboxylesterase 1 [Jatropha curcas]|uniref:carboxylesterase 1 n=1 Tax=Jatropha curcas TaxID=180498 RepID=UPI0005FC1304|nr:carboxylesterase 1 [Jatropha curcas]
MAEDGNAQVPQQLNFQPEILQQGNPQGGDNGIVQQQDQAEGGENFQTENVQGDYPPSDSITDPYKYLRIIPASDGTITRLPEIPIPNLLSASDSHPMPILTKDLTINQSNETWARIFLPKQTQDHSFHTKLPLIVWFHGGGFILFSPVSTFYQDFCAIMAIQLSAVVVSIKYRLAPEHRLPAAYEDAVEAVRWIKTIPDEWLRDSADLNNCFLMGSSAGANIAYHAGLKLAATMDDHYLQPLKIRGLILHQPFFGGSRRIESELRMVNDPHLPLCCADLMWKLALRIGADRDHEYCNPTVEGGSNALTKMKELGWRILVDWGDKDPLMDRHEEFVNMLQEKGIQVVSQFFKGHCHGIELVDPSKCNALNSAYKSFISCSLNIERNFF